MATRTPTPTPSSASAAGGGGAVRAITGTGAVTAPTADLTPASAVSASGADLNPASAVSASGADLTPATAVGALGTELITVATRVARMGCCPADVATLSDAQLESFQRKVADLQSCVKTFAALGAGEIARRSSFEAGYSGFSRSGGHATPEQRIQSLTGVKLDEAREAVRVGQMNIAHENAAAAA